MNKEQLFLFKDYNNEEAYLFNDITELKKFEKVWKETMAKECVHCIWTSETNYDIDKITIMSSEQAIKKFKITIDN